MLCPRLGGGGSQGLALFEGTTRSEESTTPGFAPKYRTRVWRSRSRKPGSDGARLSPDVCHSTHAKEAAVRMILLVALGSAVAVSGRAQAPDAGLAQPPSVFRVQARTMSRQADGGLSMSDVVFHFSDGTQLSAKEAISPNWTAAGRHDVELRKGAGDPGAAPREFILTGDVRLTLNDKSTFLR
jgi:hypothetical protein